MVFCFSFFTYNFQRFIKFRAILNTFSKPGTRLKWMMRKKALLTITSIIAGIIGLICSSFITPLCFLILIPMGGLSTFYVVPLVPFYKKSPTLRGIPYLKIFIIGFVWSIIVVGLPILNSQNAFYFKLDHLIAFIFVFIFTIAITLPFDIRDIDYDKNSELKTIPRLLGIRKTVLLSQFLLILSICMCYFSNLESHHFYSLLIGHLISIIVINFSKKERSELFFAGLIEGLILVNYGCVLIAELIY